MAIDLFFYVTNRKESAQELLGAIRYRHPEIFSGKFIIYEAKDANDIHKEIALEHGLNACSMFMISLNDKNAAAMLLDVARMVKNTFGAGNIIAMRGSADGLI